MIVRNAGAHLLLITQPEHARAARAAMEQWPTLGAHPRRGDILVAIEHHDAMWAAGDAAPRIDVLTGAVVDFLQAPLDIKQEWRSAAVVDSATHPWSAALIAHHRRFVYRRCHGDAAWSRFFADVDAGYEALRAQAGLPASALDDDYAFLRLGDLISLSFCTGSTVAEPYDRWTVRGDGHVVRVTPEEFDRAVPIAVSARRLPSRRFTSDDDLRRVYADAPSETLEGTIVF
jgi:hypothetical protein